MRLPLSIFTKLLDEISKADKYALINSKPVFDYVDGKKTDTICAYKYTVANPDTFECFDVKVSGNTPVITQTQIDASEERMFVIFDNAVVKPYRVEFGKADCAVVADTIKIVK